MTRTDAPSDIDDASTATNPNHDIYMVPGLRRGLLVLETLARERRPMTVAEIAKSLGLTRSSVFRLAYTLTYMRFLEERPDSKQLSLGPRVLNIGYAFLASKDIVEVARAELEALRDQTNVSAHLAIRDGRDVLYLACLQTRSGFLSTLNVGTRLPAHATPMGWLMLSELSHRELGDLYRGIAFESLTPQTPRSLRDLASRVATAAEQGFAISHGAVEPGGSSIAAPVRGRDGRIVAAIDLSAPDSAFDMTQFDTRDVDAVRRTAQRISERLGYAAVAAPAPARVPAKRDGSKRGKPASRSRI